MLEGKNVLIGVTGSIAAYKAAYLVSGLKKYGADVQVVLTENGSKFISPLTFETLTNNKCYVDTFDRNFKYEVEHISLAKKADVLMVAPATANFIAKAANGIADDMLTTVFLAATCPKYVAPAMNTAMYENSATQENINKLKAYGVKIIEPAVGELACGDEGKGKMEDPYILQENILYEVAFPKILEGKRVLVTAGPTVEPIDPVRFITNHSSGKMGYAIARACAMMGAKVTLVSGPTNMLDPLRVKVVRIGSAAEMCDAVMEAASDSDFIFKAAAVADYRPETMAKDKIKKTEDSESGMILKLAQNEDILLKVKSIRRDDQVICGFAMETENLLENARGKLDKKGMDMICANSLREEGAGFQSDTNKVTIITKNEEIPLAMMSKLDTAVQIVKKAVEIYEAKQSL